VLVAFVWGVWHGDDAKYGFCRIYDAKVAHSLNLTRRLDFALCRYLVCYRCPLSPQRKTDTLESYYLQADLSFPQRFSMGRSNVCFCWQSVSAVFLQTMSGRVKRKTTKSRKAGPSRHEHFLLVVLHNIVSERSCRHRMFEVFHDVQYSRLSGFTIVNG